LPFYDFAGNPMELDVLGSQMIEIVNFPKPSAFVLDLPSQFAQMIGAHRGHIKGMLPVDHSAQRHFPTMG
jgi:hypothetical protein